MRKLRNGDDGLCPNEAEADGYCDEHHPLAHLFEAPKSGPLAVPPETP